MNLISLVTVCCNWCLYNNCFLRSPRWTGTA